MAKHGLLLDVALIHCFHGERLISPDRLKTKLITRMMLLLMYSSKLSMPFDVGLMACDMLFHTILCECCSTYDTEML